MRIFLTICVLLAVIGSLGACTINIYHPVPASLPGQHSPQSPETILDMTTTGSGRESDYTVGEEMQLNVQMSVDAYAHCYYQQADGRILQVYPNPHMPQKMLKAGQLLHIPDTDRFQILADTAGRTEAFMCLASCDELSEQLPDMLRPTGFEPLDVRNFDEMYDLYRRSTASSLVGRVITVRVNGT